MTKVAKPADTCFLGRDVLRSLTEEQWLDLLNDLKLFDRRVNSVTDRRDLVQEAILAVLEGRRSWDLKKTPFHNLCLILKSVSSNERAKDSKYAPLDPEVEQPARDAAVNPSLNLSSIECYEERESEQNFLARLYASLQGDGLSIRVVKQLIDDGQEWKPQIIAARLGKTVREINNLRKRLRRKLKALGAVRKRIL